jgi:hypothetical protein
MRSIASTAAADRARSAQPAMASLMNAAKLLSNATAWTSKAWAREELSFNTPTTSTPSSQRYADDRHKIHTPSRLFVDPLINGAVTACQGRTRTQS